jgi:3-deoxy-D-manno-octulosonic-acid transferase
LFPAGLAERATLLAYRLLWVFFLPAALVYLWVRGRKEPLYRRFVGERLGFVRPRLDRPVWMHCASLGELRGIAPLIRALISGGYPVWVSTLTPAGRNAVPKLFGPEIETGRLAVAYAPLESASAVGRVLRALRPRCVLMVENDVWPVLLSVIQAEGVPLAMVNAQYSARSLQRDQHWWGFRSAAFRSFDRILCKSDVQAARFQGIGARGVVVAGETRFDVPVPQHLLDRAAECAQRCGLGPGGRPVIALASIVESEEAVVLPLLASILSDSDLNRRGRPLVIFVPRQPHRFDAVMQSLVGAGFSAARRSAVFDTGLGPTASPGDKGPDELAQVDVLLGDSLGEMFFYLALSEVVFVGGSFSPLGAHNVIEPMALGKPVVVGPETWTIEFPAVEALAAGALIQVQSPNELVPQLSRLLTDPEAYRSAAMHAASFYQQHAGATSRHLTILEPWLRLNEQGQAGTQR